MFLALFFWLSKCSSESNRQTPFSFKLLKDLYESSIFHHQIFSFFNFSRWLFATSNPATGLRDGLHLMKTTNQNLCIALRETQRGKLRSIGSAGTLLSRGHVQEGNLCSLPCTTSKAVVCWLPYAASLQRAVKKDITKHQTQITQCQVPSSLLPTRNHIISHTAVEFHS